MAFSGNFMCTSFKVELMRAVHNFTTSTNTIDFTYFVAVFVLFELHLLHSYYNR